MVEAGQLIGGRYVVETIAGAGGMGRVYRAHIQGTEEQVALKVLNLDAKRYSRRFNREAQLLKELEHPSIVRFIDNGITGAGEPFIVMEWVDGEDVRQRMNRKPLTPSDTLIIIRQVALALAAAHQSGIVHRDLKPSNLMLVNQDHNQCKLLDFGIARWRGPLVDKMTKTGISIGTPGYMAPEQARGDKDIDGRADIFALGCVVYEVLTGRRPFAGESRQQTQVKPLSPPRISSVRDDISAPFDNLVVSMLADDPALRPRDGKTLVDLIDSMSSAAKPQAAIMTPRITGGERKLLSMVILQDLSIERVVTETVDIPADPGTPNLKGPRRLDVADAHADLYKVIHEYGGQIAQGMGPLIRAVFQGKGAATDLVRQAAQCALMLRIKRPFSGIVFVTGRGEYDSNTQQVGGDVVERANELTESTLGASTRTSELVTENHEIHIDEVTAGLLDSRFDIGGDGAALVLRGERAELATRQFLGKKIACIGREPEFAYLDRLFRDVVSERKPKGVLLVAPAGVGKTRLQTEWIKRLRARYSNLSVLSGRADPVARGEAFHVLSRVIRNAARIVQLEPLSVRHKKLNARIHRHLKGDRAQLVAEFLGEMSGTPYPAHEDRIQLRAARADATLMGDQIRLSWEKLIAAESLHQPTLIVLEDLHCGDLPTIRLIDGVLRNVTEGAWMLLAVARPEISEVHPNLWEKHKIETIKLSVLSETAQAAIIRQVLGDGIDPGSIKRLTRLAAGNAYYLEELIRAVTERRVHEVPGTILAMAQARLGQIPAYLRRILRAASVFGRIFWRGSIEALIGTDEVFLDLDNHLEELEDLEFIQRKSSTAFPNQNEFTFCHELVREAAYSTLTEGDKRIGHKLAGDWLESKGSSDAMTLATHFELGGEPSRATKWYARSAEQALEGDDLDAVLKRIQKGIACGAEGETLGHLRLIEAKTLHWRGEYAAAEERSASAMEHLDFGSTTWYESAGMRVSACGALGMHQRLISIANEMLQASEGTVARGPQVTAIAKAAAQLLYNSRYDEGALLLQHLPEDLVYFAEKDPAVVGHVLTARAYRHHQEGDLGMFLELFEEATHFFEISGNKRSATVAQVNIGFAYLQLGDFSASEAILRKVLEASERMALSTTSAMARNNLGCVLMYLGRYDEAWDHELMAIESFALQGNEFLANNSRVYLSRILQRMGKLQAAEREVREAVSRTKHILMIHTQALTQLGSVLVERNRLEEACEVVEKALAFRKSLNQALEVESELLLLVHEVYLRLGRAEDARVAVREAYENLQARQLKIRDPGWRACFMRNKSENRRIMDLAIEAGLTTG